MVGVTFQLVPEQQRGKINCLDTWGPPQPPPHGDLPLLLPHGHLGTPSPTWILGYYICFHVFLHTTCIAFSQIIGKGVLIFMKKWWTFKWHQLSVLKPEYIYHCKLARLLASFVGYTLAVSSFKTGSSISFVSCFFTRAVVIF